MARRSKQKPNHIRYKPRGGKLVRSAKIYIAIGFPDGESKIIEVDTEQFALELANILKKLDCEVTCCRGLIASKR